MTTMLIEHLLLTLGYIRNLMGIGMEERPAA
jgi:hypothetical protein